METIFIVSLLLYFICNIVILYWFWNGVKSNIDIIHSKERSTIKTIALFIPLFGLIMLSIFILFLIYPHVKNLEEREHEE